MLTFALRDGRPVHVDDVPNGKACGCVCPQCGGALIACNGGSKKEHHFAHTSDARRECEWAVESALHLLAKEVLQETGRMALPPVVVEANPPEIPFDVVISEAGPAELGDVEAERPMSGFKPDLIATVRNASGRESRLMIEICVTHAVDEEKLERVAQEGISMVEVCLGDLDREITRDVLAEVLASDHSRTSWVYNAKSDLLHQRAANDVAERRSHARIIPKGRFDYGHGTYWVSCPLHQKNLEPYDHFCARRCAHYLGDTPTGDAFWCAACCP